MGQAIGDLLPSAVGVALSPVPIIAVILMLGTPRARTNGPAFAAGWIVGLGAVSVLVATLASRASDAESETSTAVDVGKLAIGLLFLHMAVRQWRGRPRAGEAPTLPEWMSSVDHFTPWKSVGLGLLLSAANPKNLALTFAAASSIARAGLDDLQSAEVILLFVALGSLTVVGPVVWFVLARESAEKRLTSIKQFMTEHNAVIMMVVLVVLGAKLLGDGITGLTA